MLTLFDSDAPNHQRLAELILIMEMSDFKPKKMPPGGERVHYTSLSSWGQVDPLFFDPNPSNEEGDFKCALDVFSEGHMREGYLDADVMPGDLSKKVQSSTLSLLREGPSWDDHKVPQITFKRCSAARSASSIGLGYIKNGIDVETAWCNPVDLTYDCARFLARWVDSIGEWLPVLGANWKETWNELPRSELLHFSQSTKISLSMQFSRRYMWHVVVSRPNGTSSVAIPTDPAGAREAFKLRDIPSGKKRRTALKHWVNGHWRKLPENKEGVTHDTLVREHLRGNTTFTWEDLKCRIVPSDFDRYKVEQAIDRANVMKKKGLNKRIST